MAELQRRISLPELRRWADFYVWENEARSRAAHEVAEEARRAAQVEAQLAGYRR